MKAVGINNEIEFDEQAVVIRGKTIFGIPVIGVRGEKTIPASSITTVSFRKATIFANGHINLSIKGEIDPGSIDDSENTVFFKQKHNAAFEELRRAIERKIVGQQ